MTMGQSAQYWQHLRVSRAISSLCVASCTYSPKITALFLPTAHGKATMIKLAHALKCVLVDVCQ